MKIELFPKTNNLKRRFVHATAVAVLMNRVSPSALNNILDFKLVGSYAGVLRTLLYLTSLRDGIQLNHRSVDTSLIFLHSYANKECVCTTVLAINKYLRVINLHLNMAQDGLVSQKSLQLNSYVLTQNDTLITVEA